MTEILVYPGVVATVLLGVVLAYWLFVMFGALDVDLLGHGAAEGAAKGAMDAVADGAIEGASKGVAEGAVKGILEGSGEGGGDGGHDGSHDGGGAETGQGHATDLMSVAHFRSVPVTVMLSTVVCFAWPLCMVGARSVQSVASALPLPVWVLGTLVLVLSFMLALVPTALAIKPLSRFFVTHQAKANTELVGKVCVVNTGTVSVKFGQATLQSDGMSLLVQVRSDGDGALKKGDRALIVAWDDTREAFLVEPYEEFMRGR